MYFIIDDDFEYSDRLDPNKEANLSEETFKINEFQRSFRFKELFALAMRCRSLLLMEKGTIPSNINIGVGIRNYVMDLATNDLLSEIQNEVQTQINTYIPNDLIKEIIVEYTNSNNNSLNKTLSVILAFGDNGTEDVRSITLNFGKNSATKNKLVSQVLY